MRDPAPAEKKRRPFRHFRHRFHRLRRGKEAQGPRQAAAEKAGAMLIETGLPALHRGRHALERGNGHNRAFGNMARARRKPEKAVRAETIADAVHEFLEFFFTIVPALKAVLRGGERIFSETTTASAGGKARSSAGMPMVWTVASPAFANVLARSEAPV